MSNLSSKTIAFALACASVSTIVPTSGAAEPLDRETVAAALVSALGLNGSKQDVFQVTEEGEHLLLKVHRDNLLQQSGIGLFSRYLPGTFTLKLSDKGGYAFLSADPIGGYTSNSAIGAEAGTATVDSIDIRGVIPFGLIGQGILSTELKSISYKSKDGRHETSASGASLNVYRNQRFLSPTTLQLMYSLSDVSERTTDADNHRFQLRMGSMLYTMLIGSTDTSAQVKQLWDGQPFMKTVFPEDGVPLRTMVAKARAIETTYSASNVDYSGTPLPFYLQKFSVKYQSKRVGGSAGRFDIGLDHLSIRGGPVSIVLNALVPEHVWFSGEVGEIDYAALATSRDAVLNPFSEGLQLIPIFAKATSFQIPAFKFAGFDENMDFGGSGTLTIRPGNPATLNGSITLRLKKGRERLEAMLAQTSNDPRAERLLHRLRKAYALGKQESDGSTSFDITVAHSVVSIGGTQVW